VGEARRVQDGEGEAYSCWFGLFPVAGAPGYDCRRQRPYLDELFADGTIVPGARDPEIACQRILLAGNP
jgi:hypothetical protein